MAARMPEDLAEFCRREYPRLVGTLDLYLGGELAVAEELAQEALLRACSRWRRVAQLESPGGWVHRVAMNLATSHLRRRAAEARARSRLVPAPAGPPGGDPDAVDVIRRAVAALPPRQRTALVLRYYLDLPTGEAAEHLGVSEQAMRALVARGMARLRAQLGDRLEPVGRDD